MNGWILLVLRVLRSKNWITLQYLEITVARSHLLFNSATHVLKSFSNQNKKEINNLNLVKELIEDQKDFYSSFPAPIIPIEKTIINTGNNKLISYKRLSIL